MDLLICGSRHWTDQRKIVCALSGFPKDTHVIHGDCRGADKLAGNIATTLGMTVTPFPADWSVGKQAGIIRNTQMLKESPDLVIAFHSDILSSKGTIHMMRISKKAGIPVVLIE